MMKFSYFYLFRLSCLLIFSYQSYRCLEEFINQEANTKEFYSYQEETTRPQVCFAVPKFEFVQDQLSDDDFDEYLEGDWKMNRSSAEEFYESVSAELEDLVSEIRVYKLLGPLGDKYDKIKYKLKDDDDWKQNFKIDRKDYHDFLKAYCVDVRNDVFPHGIARLYFYTKTNFRDQLFCECFEGNDITFRLFLIQPGKLFDASRKFNEMEIEKDYDLRYVVK